MLEIIKYNNKKIVEKHFAEMDTVSNSWVIPNLKTKTELQEKNLKEKGYNLSSTILRIRDLWTSIFHREFNEYKIISNETFLILVKNILEKYKTQIQLDLIDYQKKCKDLNYFIGMILDDSFDLNSERFIEWMDVFDRRKFQLKSELLVNQLIAKILINQKTIPFDWVTTLLQNKTLDLTYFKQSKFYFDLGSEISHKEAELIYQISKTKDVLIFEADYGFNHRYDYLLKPYEYLNSKCSKEFKKKITEEISEKSIQLRQFSNSVAECRDVVGQVKEWLIQGIPPEKIQILAPEIEMYWRQLSPLFRLEKVPVKKDKVLPVVSLPQVQRMMAKIKFYQKTATAVDLEKILFLNSSKNQYPYQQMRSLFSSPFLTYNELIAKLIEYLPGFIEKELGSGFANQHLNPEEEVTLENFLNKFSNLFESELNQEQFDFIITQLLAENSSTILFPVNDWFEWLKLSLYQMEMKLEENSVGIKIDSLMSSQSFPADYVYVLGAEETHFSQQHRYQIEPLDILSLASDLGYYLDHPEFNFKSYELETIKEKTNKEMIFSYAQRDLLGEITNPCFLWQRMAFENKILEKHRDIQKQTTWDQYQKMDPLVFVKKANSNEGGVNYETSLSPSSIKKYIDCSFKFFMEKELKLNETDIEEIDISSKEKGLWYHHVFQKIIEDQNIFFSFWQENNSDEQRRNFLQQHFEKEIPPTVSKDFWRVVSKKYYQSVTKFIDHELTLKRNHPGLSTYQCEAKWAVYFDLQNQKWANEKPEKGFLLKGSIDRILIDEKTQKAWVIDYKLGSSQALTFQNWLKEDHWQLLFYVLAVEKGWVENLKREVELAQFWVINKWNIKKGFAFEPDQIRKNLISAEEKKELFLDFEKKLIILLNEMLLHKYIPQPKEEEICKRCDWSKLCRAPHLN